MSKLDLRNPIHLIATGFGSGLAPRAPGTFGTLTALIPWWPMHFLPTIWYGIIIAAGIVTGIYVCEKTAHHQRTHDHQSIVWDEFVGLWITLAWIPVSPAWIAAGFLLFRLIDIWKPWPISWCDKQVRGGFGIMIDDILAGVFACALLQTARLILPG